jgi:hypothetical protein
MFLILNNGLVQEIATACNKKTSSPLAIFVAIKAIQLLKSDLV